MKNEILNSILSCGGLFCGGFVRDWLILGGEYNDIDFYFEGTIPEKFRSWKSNGRARVNVIDGVIFSLIIMNPHSDLSCNLFCFDGEKIFARPTRVLFSYAKSWELIFDKKFVYTNETDIRCRIKMLEKGWTQDRIDTRQRAVVSSPLYGPWSDFTLAKERFDALAL
jgi:hypothetical protein